MKAIVFAGECNVCYESVADPIIEEAGDAVVRVERAGICGSDMHIYHGREKGLDCGTVLGHEFTGEIVALGAEVNSFRIGDQVCSPFTINCGDCFFCAKGLTARCSAGQGFFGWVQDGKGLQGAQAEFVRVPLAVSTLVSIPAGLSNEEALLLGDNFATGYFCADMAEVKPADICVVIGCGVVGLFSILAARERGAETIIAVDMIPYRLQLAQEMGADQIATPDDAKAIVCEATSGRGADAILEAVGITPAQELAMRLIRPGGILAVVGMHTAKSFAFRPSDAYNLNLTYKTGRCPARYYMEKLPASLEKNREMVRRLITHQLPLSRGADGYRMFDRKEDGCLKIVLDPTAGGRG